ncbi:MAG: hypothetical protein KIC92_09910, partial [Clostridiales bacterium]|nr:hypothetical protein [Clostridiales bacterium]
NPVIGRFTQEDTYRGDGLNLYAYCANNPVYYVDPSGNVICRSKALVLKAKRNYYNKYNLKLKRKDIKQLEEYEKVYGDFAEDVSKYLDLDYSKIRAYKGIDIHDIPVEIRADPRLLVEMPYIGKKSNANAAGWKRDQNEHARNLLSSNPEFWSNENKLRIKLEGKIPVVDEEFIKYFPQYKDFLGDELRHHHIGGGGQVIFVPESLHKGFGGIHNVEKIFGIRDNDYLTEIMKNRKE